MIIVINGLSCGAHFDGGTLQLAYSGKASELPVGTTFLIDQQLWRVKSNERSSFVVGLRRATCDPA